MVVLLFLMPLFYYSPNVILGAIIVTAVIGLIDFGAMWKLWKADKLDFLACISAFLGVLFISVQMGLAIAVLPQASFQTYSISITLIDPLASLWSLMRTVNFNFQQVGISVFKILIHVTRPKMVTLGNIPGTQIYQNIGHYMEATRLASVLIIRVESPIYFANSSYVQERLVGFQFCHIGPNFKWVFLFLCCAHLYRIVSVFAGH